MEDVTAPEGLFLSLDALIQRSTKLQGRQQPGGRGGGRGGGGSGGGRGFAPGRSGFQQQDGIFQRGGGQDRFGKQGGRGLGVAGGVSKPGRGGSFQRGGGGQFSGGGGHFSGGGRFAGGAQQQPRDLLAYRKYQQCYLEETGDVVVVFHQTAIIRITARGDITLNSGGFHTDTTLASFNDALAPVGVKVSAPDIGPAARSQWLVSDGRSLFRFEDNMTLASKGAQSAARGPLVLQAFENPDAAAASAASNAAAAAVGILPKNAPGVPLELGNPKRSWARGQGNNGNGGIGSGGGGGGDAGGQQWGGFSAQHRPRRRAGGGYDVDVEPAVAAVVRHRQYPDEGQDGGGGGGGYGSGGGGGGGGDYGGGAGAGRHGGYSARHARQQRQQANQQQQARWREQRREQWQDMEYEEAPQFEKPERQYGSGGMRADGYDAEDMAPEARGGGGGDRARARLRAQGRLDQGY